MPALNLITLLLLHVILTLYFSKLFPPGGGLARLVTSGWSNHLPSRITSPLDDAAGLDASSCCKWKDNANEYANLWSPRYLSGATKYTSCEPAVSTLNDPLEKKREKKTYTSEYLHTRKSTKKQLYQSREASPYEKSNVHSKIKENLEP